MAVITGLFVYPVKSCRGIELQASRLAERGLQHDREWMIVDAQNRFLTQRTHPRLAQIETALMADALTLSSSDRELLQVPLALQGERRMVSVWTYTGPALDQGEEAARWLSGLLGEEVRLVRFDYDTQRLCDPDFAGQSGAHTAFSDAYPALVIGEESLADLNRRLGKNGHEALPINRFRPNVVVAGIEAFEEDYIDTLSVGTVQLKLVKPCTRCAITTTDQKSGKRGDEPLLTLASYRMDTRYDGITFGQNAIISAGMGQSLCVGDELEVAWRF
jgi:uncharacterized protein YcbX